jgi:hypothetical protein
MMKQILFLLLVALTYGQAGGQDQEINMPLDEKTGLITYQEVVEVQGTKDELFNRCSSWLHTFYANPWEATKVRDQATGLIKIEHQFRIYNYDEAGVKTEAGMILYKVKLEFKQDKYRYTIDDLLLKQLSRYPLENWLDKTRQDYDTRYLDYLKQIDTYFRDELIKTLKEAMVPKEEIKEAEW